VTARNQSHPTKSKGNARMIGTRHARGPAARALALLTAGILVGGCASPGTTPAPGSPDASGPANATPTVAPTEAPAGPTQEEIDKALSTPTTITYWSWDLSAAASVEAFMDLHPAITIEHENVGVGPAQYQKVRTALAAGSGIPDVVFMEGAYLPSFAFTDSLLDLSTMGASGIKDLFLDAAWNSGVSGDQILGLAVGSNATASYYRTDLLEDAGITAHPETWEQFALDAKTLYDKTGAAIATFPPNDSGMFWNSVFQAGISPFEWTPGTSDVKISLNSPEMKELVGYWEELISAGYASTVPAWVDAYWQAFDGGKIATWQAGVWGSPVLEGTTKTSGKWRLAGWPQWTSGERTGALWQGGVTDAVMKATENPIVAYEFLKFRSTDPEFATQKYTEWGWDPVLKSVIEDPAWLALTDEFLGDQASNVVWADALSNVGTKPTWLPFMEFVTAAYTETVGTAAVEGTGLAAGLDAWQQKVVDYATQQGFTVAP
jgi:multiple sugar transport system substrate-binding protein